MILIGQYDSPFVRRVAIALTLYPLPFEHNPWSVFGDMQKVQAYNPLVRVPALVLDDGAVLIESHCILDYLDGLVGVERALFPATGVARRDALKIAALATGMGDKAVSLFYERACTTRCPQCGSSVAARKYRVWRGHWRPIAAKRRERTGLANAWGTRTSPWLPCCASSARRIRGWLRWSGSRRWPPMPRAWRPCRCFRPSHSRLFRRPEATLPARSPAASQPLCVIRYYLIMIKISFMDYCG